MKKILIVVFKLSIASFLLVNQEALAQHPIEVQKAALNSEYWKALTTYDKMPKRTATVEATIAAGKAAWALSLPDRAKQEFDKALLSDDLSKEERSELLLSRGIIEFQEGNYAIAVLFAEKAVNLFDQSHVLRGRSWLLWGESLYYQGIYGAAEHKYRNALKEIEPKSQNELRYLLARCQLKNGKGDDAFQNFSEIPLDHERAPDSIRHLAGIALNSEDFAQAKMWLEQGRKHYPNEFLDSWVDYVLVSVAVENKTFDEALKIQEQAVKIYPPSDYWLTLIDSKIEVALWKERNSKNSNASKKLAKKGDA